MSASDLVPRVMLLVSDLKRENEELKSQIKEQEDQQLLIQITGPNRTPIHYVGSLKHGYSNGEEWRVLVFAPNHDNHVVLSLSSFIITGLELWLAGILIDHFQNINRLYDYGYGFVPAPFDARRSEKRMRDIGCRGARHPGCYAMYGSMGPMTYTEYTKVMDEQQLDFEEQIASHTCNNISLIIKTIDFRKDKIRGMMSLLEKLHDDENDEEIVVDFRG